MYDGKESRRLSITSRLTNIQEQVHADRKHEKHESLPLMQEIKAGFSSVAGEGM